ncbi:outer membrane protein assembly factor BamC [Paucibacter oligotrophus]|uniref:Outer membrane protein assembly factor BamC n=2 Tax=Roseateles oligotrophus TaxID=1769250 RepID=A0A840L6Z2_9BURK|nr:outer membrane protein assembly factor BamC [Roseateles oligotrophus]
MTRSSIASSKTRPVSLACLLMVGALAAGCSSLDNVISTDKVDYRSGAKQTTGLDVPPDLSQLARDGRAQQQGGVVSAATFQQNNAAAKANAQASSAAPANTVALNAAGNVRLERNGSERFLRVDLPPEQLWPQVREFWIERGFEIAKEQADIGLIETNWNENRAKLPQDIIRSTIGRVFDGLYSSGERDMYRSRIERVAGGTEIHISHKGVQEVYTSQQKDSTAWQPRPSDPMLEGEMLSRLMLKLGAKEEAAKAALQAAASQPAAVATGGAVATAGAAAVASKPQSRSLAEVPDELQVAEGFERAWRRVGQSLDRHGFTVEDRDRKQGLFYLRYADPNQAGKEEPNFFQKLFSKDEGPTKVRYRVMVKSEGERSTVSVLDDKGQKQTNEIAKRILNLLMDDLR